MADIVSTRSIRGALCTLPAADHERVLGACGIPIESLQDDATWFGRAVWAQLWTELERATGDPWVGLHAAAAAPRDTFDVLTYVCETSRSLGEALEQVQRYLPVVAATAEMSIDIDAELVEIGMRVVEHPDHPYPHHVFDFVLTSLFVGVSNAAQEVCAVQRLRLTGTRPTDSATEYERVFGCAPEFSSVVDAFSLPASLLDSPMRAPNPRLHSLLVGHAEHLLAFAPVFDDPLRGVRPALLRELRGGNPTLERVADQLDLSARSLQRRLSAAGTSFSKILEELRSELAKRYVASENLRLESIAILLGYGDLSSFDRAFRRWTGTTPSAFRRQSRTQR